MKKSKIIATSLLLSVVLGTSLNASAASTTNKMDVEFEINEDTTKPVNPVDPDPEKPVKPGKPGDGNETGQPGPLSIDYLTNFKFGKQKMSGNDNRFFARNSTLTYVETNEVFEVPNFIQITDNRGAGQGWGLTVKQEDPLTNTVNKSAVIKSTTLNLKNGVVSSANKGKSPVANPKIQVVPGGSSVTVMNAAAGQGMGTWANLFGADATKGAKSVELVIPGNQAIAKGSYGTTLTWTLSDSPSN